jgi:hypothetical protein
MSPLSTGVLGAATLVSAPALWLGLVDRTLPLDVALTRYLVAVGLCWAALSVVATWAFPDPGSVKLDRPIHDDRGVGGRAPSESATELEDA